MPIMTISLDGVVLKDIELKQPRTTLGRRPYNDIVVDNLAVSGEHAVIVLKPEGVELVDLNSTNGTYLNGKAIVSALVRADDVIEIGRYQMRIRPDAMAEPPQASPMASEPTPGPASARIRVLNGPAAGKEMALTKVVTTLGKPGIAVAAINQRSPGYTLTLVDGDQLPLVNGQPIGKEPVPLNSNDVISLAGTEMQIMY